MKNQCEICNRVIEEHLRKQGKRLCFSCLTEDLSQNGSVPTFNIKNKPVQAPCAICDLQVSSADLFPSPWGFICRGCCDVCETQTGLTWDMVKLASQKEWILKSNGRILGPYMTEEVEASLRENRLVAHDEIIRPAGRWKLLRDEEQFRVVVNEMRNRRVNRKEGSMADTQSGTMTPTAEDMVREQAFQTETLIQDINKFEREREVKSFEAPPATRDLVKSYAARGDVRVQKEVIDFRHKRVWLAIIFLVSAGIFSAIRVLQPRVGNSERNSNFRVLMEAGLGAEKVGDYQRALSSYSEARMVKPNDPELLLHLAPLALLYDKQMLQAQRMFKEILEVENAPNYKRAAYSGLGLIALDAHELESAQDYFNKARGVDDYMPAVANMGVVSFFKDDLGAAQGFLYRAVEQLGSDGAIVIALADVLIAEASNDPRHKVEYLTRAHTLLDKYLEIFRDYDQEVLVVDARILTILGKSTEAARRIESFLDVDPEQTDLHVRDWAIYRGRASWGLLLDSLKKTAGDLAPSPRLTAAVGLAMYRGREKLEGAQSIRMALQQAPQDPLLMALAGWVELKLGQTEPGNVYIKQAAAVSDKLKLPHILLARICQEQKDYVCARNQWSNVLRIDPRSVEGLAGLGYTSWYGSHDRGRAQIYLNQVLASDPSYIPYLQLVQEIGNATAAASEAN